MSLLKKLIILGIGVSFHFGCGSSKKPNAKPPTQQDIYGADAYGSGFSNNGYAISCDINNCPPVNIQVMAQGAGGANLLGFINQTANWSITATASASRNLMISVTGGAPDGCTFNTGGATASCSFNPNSTANGTIQGFARDITRCEIMKQQNQAGVDCYDMSQKYPNLDQDFSQQYSIVENNNGVDQNYMSQLNYKPKDNTFGSCAMGMLPGLLSGLGGGGINFGGAVNGCLGGIQREQQQNAQLQQMHAQMMYQQALQNQQNQGYNQQYNQNQGYYLQGNEE